MYGAVGGAVAASSAAAASTHVYRLVLGGPIVQVDSDYFVRIVSGNRDKVLVVHAVVRGLFSKKHVYATNYRGFTFVTKTKEPLPIIPDVEAKKIWLPPSLP